MARPKAANWIAEATTTSGTGTVTLAGPLEGFAQFKVMQDGMIYYTIQDGVDKECGVGMLTANGTQITRDTVLASFVGGVYASPGQHLDLSGYAECYCTVNADLFNSMNDALDKLDGIEPGATADQTSSEVAAAANWLYTSGNVQGQLDESADSIAMYIAGTMLNIDPDLVAIGQVGRVMKSALAFVNVVDMSVYKFASPVSGTIKSITYSSTGTAVVTTSSPSASINATRIIAATRDWVDGRESRVLSINATDSLSIDASLALTFDVTLNSPQTIMSLILSSEPANTQHEVIVILRQGTGANKVSWPNNVDWAYGSEPVLAFQQGKYDRFQLIKLQGQNNWMASTVGGTYG